MKTAWMVRSGGRGAYMELFESGVVGIDFGVDADLSTVKSLEEIKRLHAKAMPQKSKWEAALSSGILDKFVRIIKEGDGVITYDPETRTYLVGRIAGPYYYEKDVNAPLRHRRRVDWEPMRVSRDDLLPGTRNSLGSLLTIFSVNADSWNDLQSAMKGGKEGVEKVIPAAVEKTELEQDKRTLQEQAHERLKDRVVLLDEQEMQELLAAVLRAMGFRTTVSPAGPDRGVDVLASPDGLGLQEPRIKCEVKHRKRSQMGAPEIRSFLGGLREGDKGVYLSTGGFSKEAHYEAERANVPVKLLDLDDLAQLIETHYESFDAEGRSLLPLTRIYWPAD